ncbi:MAG: DUF2232 domain-containing protein [Peptoniphilaceae bacterium]|nr:YybS family protein [Peptoniphilaceae bacterium]MDD7383895.1 DUF2232 domain-containing protein [Peptoniphilaceae bacterium]MDY3738036.1 DUF2232 domain-containing protein [Peptoniphilaceae bacterium]
MEKIRNNYLNGLFLASLSMIFIFLSSYSSLMLFCVPIILTSVIILNNNIEKALMVIITFFTIRIVGGEISDYYKIGFLYIISIMYFILIRKNVNDLKALIISTVFLSVILCGIWYFYIKDNYETYINILESYVSTIVSSKEEALKYAQTSIKTVPSFIFIFSLGFSLLSLTLIRKILNSENENFLKFKKLNEIRLEKNKFFVFILSLITIYVVFRLFLNLDILILNSIIIVYSLLVFNGITVLDFLMQKTNSGLNRFLLPVILILFIQFSLVYAGFGIADLFVDFRKKFEEKKDV